MKEGDWNSDTYREQERGLFGKEKPQEEEEEEEDCWVEWEYRNH
jgi:hypothetical protein